MLTLLVRIYGCIISELSSVILDTNFSSYYYYYY